MRARTFSRFFRIVSTVVLFFFVWTFGPVWQAVAWAATRQQRAEAKAQSGPSRSHPTRGQNHPPASPIVNNPPQSPLGKRGGGGVSPVPAERFEKALESIREHIGKAEEKAGRGDAATEIAEIRKYGHEIQMLDVELRKEFAATEKKLKDAKLPQEILDRHYRFVKHYEGNLKELKTNLSAVDKPSATSHELRAALQKAKAHLEKTKPPRKHVPLDPDNLPFRNRKAKAPKAPRVKKEEFEKEFGAQKKAVRSPSSIASNHEPRATNQELFHSEIVNHKLEIERKPVLLAYNGPASDIPLSLGDELRTQPVALPFTGNDFSSGINPDATFSDILSATSYEPSATLLAQAADLPTAADLAETPDVQFTQPIRDLASQLNYSPVKIHEWVRNNIEYAPLYGSIQGADQCLQSRICNDMDTASLLIALLRASGISARYVYGTVDIPIEKAMNWVGGVTNPMMVGTIFATNGVPAVLLKTSGNVYKYVRKEHVWVSAYIDYIPSRGAVHRQGDTWVPLDASYKQYTYTQGIDMAAAVPFDAQTFADQLLSTATTNTIEGYVTNVNSALIQQTMTDYQTEVQNYIQQNHPNATVGDVIGKKEIVKEKFPFLPGTLPYKTVQTGAQFAQLPEYMRATITFNIPDPTGAGAGLSYTIGMPQIAGKKVTLSFSPATAEDQAVIKSATLPFPAYLINLKPELRIDGQVVATGSSVMMGVEQAFRISLNEPGFGLSNMDNVIKAGEYFGVGLNVGRIGVKRLNDIQADLESTLAKLAAQNYSDITKDDIVGDALSTAIAAYFAELDVSDEILAKRMGLVRHRVPSLGMFSVSLDVQSVFGVPKSASAKGLMMDVDRIMQAVFSKDGNMAQVKDYMFKSGVASSAMENAVPEQLFSTATEAVNSVSAIKALQFANDQGIQIYTVNSANVESLLPQLTVNNEVKSDVINAVSAGKTVIVQKSNIEYNGWNGSGYIIVNNDTGAAAFMISSGMSGSYTPNYFSGIDFAMVLSSYTGTELNILLEGERFISVLYRAFAYIGVVVGFIMDLHRSLTDPNLTASQRAAAICLLVGIAILAGVAVYLGSIVTMTFTIFAEGVAIMLALNWVREKIMEYIVTSSVLYRVRIA